LPDPSDRRVLLLQLTPNGKKLADRAIARHFANLDGTLDDLTSRERAQLTALLAKLLHGLESCPSSS
jgi:DNA-binding MarR family transcriptional regulator